MNHANVRIEFMATEAGFKDDMGGASNSLGAGSYHYILFGLQKDQQHPDNSGVYFEFDDQSKGGIDLVKTVQLEADAITFWLINGVVVRLKCAVAKSNWNELIAGIHHVFASSLIMKQ